MTMTEQTTDIGGRSPLIGFKDTTGLGERVDEFARKYGILRGGKPNQSGAVRILLELALQHVEETETAVGSAAMEALKLSAGLKPEPEPPNGPEVTIPAGEVDFTAPLPVTLVALNLEDEEYHLHSALCPEILAALKVAPESVYTYEVDEFRTLADIARFEYADTERNSIWSMIHEVSLHVCTRAPKLVRL